ncbi:thioredoxin [Rhodoblastus acidophilus]|uniref:Thioredoxin n=1 Tax=Candidatus Rhodoblastus alkanivorans TaxID=2954117 RepID=A0ABS9Z1W7_9HYPH|nr:thioredoxin [Candidatus Rhodoblastus alkanivorans]MCI4680850.1 thioredoxin [Candidatus Rhodoblastus alkanivorans]MCI4681654.1 thioredoxin [Candidatus Rhodoblastus alkanivorans]MDI4642701.1 thioredoxin [Rhodoblastus acidophilus]
MQPVDQKTQIPAAAGADVLDVSLQNFRAEVMEESMRRLVLVDFWAPWCGPCKQLTPVLEKVVAARRGAVRLAKMNIDANPEIAQKMGIQSIPAVVAFHNGQMLDAFMGALPEGEVKAFIDRCIGPAAEDPEALFVEAQALLEAGELDSAEGVFARILTSAPDHAGALAGLARIAIARGALDEAKALLDAVPAKQNSSPAVAAARAALALQEQAGAVGDLAYLLARVENAPTDHQARYDLAVALNAAGRREAAAQELLNIIKRERGWNDDAARKLLLQLFDSWGPLDPTTRSARRQLSALLFS